MGYLDCDDSEKGSAIVEISLMVALVGVAILPSFGVLADALHCQFVGASDEMTGINSRIRMPVSQNVCRPRNRFIR